MKKLVYLRPNGEVATNVILQSVNEKTGELMFMELLGISTPVKGGLRIAGKEKYKRLFIQRVYLNEVITSHEKKGIGNGR